MMGLEAKLNCFNLEPDHDFKSELGTKSFAEEDHK